MRDTQNTAHDAIDRVLAGLREADAPEGMERRILRAMEERAVREPVRAWSWMTRPAFALPGGAVAVVLVVLAVSLMRRPGVPVVSQGIESANSVPQRLKPHGRDGGYDTAEAVPLSKAGPGKMNRSDDAGVSMRSVRSIQVSESSETLPTDLEALAVSEMWAPSKPAPPLPLTHQEKLLAQVVRKGEPEELATLRPDVRDKQMEISKAEYQEFFEPLPVKDNE